MSAASFQLRIAAPDFSRLIAAIDAAKLLDVHIASLARLCREKLQYNGMATFARPLDGGHEQWFVHRSYDPRLRPADELRHVESNLSRFTAKQQKDARLRKMCVEKLRHARMHGSADVSQLAEQIIRDAREKLPGFKISRSSLYEWDKRLADPSDLVRLVDVRGGNHCGASCAEAWAAFRDLFLHQNQPSIRQAWKAARRIAAENNWAWCSYKSCHRQLNNRIPIQDQIRARKSATYRQQIAPFIAQDSESWRAGELWIADHKQLDLICRWEGQNIRPWLSAWMDWRTRRLVGWTLSDNPNSTTILASLRHGLKDAANFGGPRCVWLDNGKDYTSWMLHGQTKQQRRESIRPNVNEPSAFGILNALKIEAHFATPYNPNGKARLERWFRTLESFCKTFDTYTGDSPETKPERLNDILENLRSIPTFKTVLTRIADHIAGYNANADHSIGDLSENGLTMSADEAMAQWCDTRRIPADAAAIDLLMMNWHRPTTVGRNGISVSLQGQTLHYGQFEPALASFKAIKKKDRRLVMVAFDPHDLRTIRVHDDKWRYLCTVPMNDVGGRHGADAISVKHVADLNRQKAIYEKSQRHIAEHSLTRILTTEEQLAGIATTPAQPTMLPSSMQIVQTPLDGQSKEIERDQMRPAVGSESTPIRRGLASPDRLRRIGRPIDRQPAPLADPTAKLRERHDAW